MATLGIIDWGIGGLGVYRELRARSPRVPVIYWSDTGCVPYGKLTADALAARLRLVVDALAARGATHVALACNAASTVADRLADARVPVRGIIPAAAGAVPRGLTGMVGVVGGARTIRAGAYRRRLAHPGRTVVSRIAQPLSGHIEAGRLGSTAFAADLAAIVRPLRGARALLLACTHYPAAAAQFAAALPGTRLIDPAARFAAQLVALVGAGGDGSTALLTTGDPDAMRAAADATWGLALARPARLRI